MRIVATARYIDTNPPNIQRENVATEPHSGPTMVALSVHKMQDISSPVDIIPTPIDRMTPPLEDNRKQLEEMIRPGKHPSLYTDGLPSLIGKKRSGGIRVCDQIPGLSRKQEDLVAWQKVDDKPPEIIAAGAALPVRNQWMFRPVTQVVSAVRGLISFTGGS
jgi:hypothetical protein